jgi:nucleotide-binding universal stress UspA family protein
MYERILVPLDGSALAEEVLPHAVQVARCAEGAEMTLIQVVATVTMVAATDPMAASGAEAAVAMQATDAAEEEAAAYLREVAARPELQGIPVQTVVTRGSAAREIIRYAQENGIDLISMSTNGRSGLGRLVFGSVADEVLREAGIPILLIRPRPRD